MDVRRALRNWAYAHPRVLLIDAPGHRDLRWVVESAVEDRAWEFAASPAGTDILIVLGQPSAELADAIEVIWSQVPEPRHRVAISTAATISVELDAALAALAIGLVLGAESPRPPDAEQALAAAKPAETQPSADMGDMGDMGDEDPGHDMGGHGTHHGGNDVGDMGDMGDEDPGHDMGGHGMHHGGAVAGLPMAQTAPDRDGLQLDSLTIALGPVLPGWPTGLVLRAQLQGDVLTDLQLSWMTGDNPRGNSSEPAVDQQAAALDDLARFLVVAGWPTAARDARRAREQLSSSDLDVRARGQVAARRVGRQVGRSRVLAWSIRGIGRDQEAAPAGHPQQHPGPVDVLSRLRRLCEHAAQPSNRPPVTPDSLEDLTSALNGQELAAARLIMAAAALHSADTPAEQAATGV
jgi:hypothetical protein